MPNNYLHTQAITEITEKVQQAMPNAIGVREYTTVAEDGLANLQTICHTLAKSSGWWNGQVAPIKPESFATKIALCHSELSEALEGGRKNTMDDHLPHRKTVEVELADTIIRILDLAGFMQLDVAGAVIEKLAYNQRRADHTPEARAANGGKVF